MKIVTPLLAFLMLITSSTFSKEAKIKFGKVNKSDLQMTVYDRDSSAVAVVLYDNGTSKIEYNQQTGWRLVFNRHQRIKILKKEGVSYGDYQIRLYKGSDDSEDISGIKAITFNLNNGKVTKDELSRKDIHKEEVNKYNDLRSFSLPNVKVGSVIDVKYTIDCKMFFRNMRPWRFQEEIPVQHSEYRVVIPEYFHFRKFTRGFEEFKSFDETQTPTVITLTSTTRASASLSGSTQASVDSETIRFNNTNYHWVAENLPAFNEEAFISTVDNYIQQVQFELQTIKFPGSQLYTYSESWESINKDLTEDHEFGKDFFAKHTFLKGEVETLIQGCSNDIEKMNKIYNYVCDNYKYNDFLSIYTQGVKKTFKEKNGNVADINFLLGAMLSVAGFDVKPVILSTRENGIFLFPTVTSFNYVVLQCICDEKKIMLDATDRCYGVGRIPYHCLNGQGLVIGGSKPEWIELQKVGNSIAQFASELTIADDGTLSGNLKIIGDGYSAINARKRIRKFDSLEEYSENYKETHTEWEIENHKVENLKNTKERIIQKIDLKINNASIFGGDRIYLSPVIFNAEKDNPFKLKERKYPVDFGHPIKETEMNIINIPEGFTIEEMPKSAMVTLPENKALFRYIVSKLGENKIQVVNTVAINTSVFLPEDYENLKTLFNNIIEKHNEQIILKKL